MTTKHAPPTFSITLTIPGSAARDAWFGWMLDGGGLEQFSEYCQHHLGHGIEANEWETGRYLDLVLGTPDK